MKNYVYMHEHTFIDLSRIKGDDDTILNDSDATIAEFKELKKRGVTDILDVTNMGMGRDVEYIQRVSKSSGMNIHLCTGFYKEPFLPQFFYEKTVEELANIMVEELEVGIESANIKAKLIGEVGSSKDCITPEEHKLLIAASHAANQTGAFITTHTTLGTAAQEQIELFKSQGVDLKKVILGHMDLSADYDYIKAALETGVTVGFDTIGKENYLDDDTRGNILARLIEKGFASQIILSMDITRKSSLKGRGGYGYCYLMDTFLPMIKERYGVSEESIHTMMQHNPRRILQLEA